MARTSERLFDREGQVTDILLNSCQRLSRVKPSCPSECRPAASFHASQNADHCLFSDLVTSCEYSHVAAAACSVWHVAVTHANAAVNALVAGLSLGT